MITIFPILALSLVVVGILSCVVMKTVAARRAESQRIGDQDQHVSVDERREFHSLISAVSDSAYSEPRAATTRSPTRSVSAGIGWRNCARSLIGCRNMSQERGAIWQ